MDKRSMDYDVDPASYIQLETEREIGFLFRHFFVSCKSRTRTEVDLLATFQSILLIWARIKEKVE